MREVEEKRVRAENRPHSGTDPGESTAEGGLVGRTICVFRTT